MSINLHEQILDGYDSLVVFSLDTKYRILTMNKSGQNLIRLMYGVTPKQGDCILDIFEGKSSASLAKEHFDRVLKGEMFTVTRKFETGKSLRIFDIMYAPLKEAGKIFGFSALVVDITEKQKQEEERFQANEMYKRLFVTSKDAIMTLEPPSWKFTTGNNTILDMFKVKDMEEWTSMGPWQVSPEVQPDGELSSDKAKRMIQTAVENGSHYFEWSHQRMNGEVFPATVLLTRVDFSERQFLQATVRDITQSKKTEEERILNETKFKNIFEGVSEGILVAGYYEGTFMYANPAILNLMGYNQEEISHIEPRSVHHKEDLSVVIDAIKKCKKKKKSQTIEIEFIKKDGSPFLGEATYSFMKWGAIDCVVAFIRDISLLKKAEKEILDNQIRYQTLFEHSNDAIIILKETGEFVTGNEAVVKLFEAEDLEMCRNTPPYAVWPEYQPDGRLSIEKVQEVIGIALEKGSNSFEWEYKKYTGETFYASVAVSRIDTFDEVLLQTSIRDISEKIKTQKRLESQNELQNLLMKISSQYINVPLDQVETTIQKSLEELANFVSADRAYIFDYNPKEGTINNTFEYCSEGITAFIDELQDVPLDSIPELTSPDKSYNYIPDTSTMPDGASKDIAIEEGIKSILTVPLIHDEKYAGLVGFDSVKNFHTYTEKEIALLQIFSNMLVNIKIRADKELELDKLLNTTKDQNQRLKEFSYITSHNMRSSVANMIGLIEVLKAAPGSEEYLEMLRVTTQKLDNSITNINELINFENENDVLQKVDCNLSEAMQRVVKLTNQIIKQKEVELKISIEESHMVKAYPAYLDSIFHNLITNALKYGITDHSKELEIYANHEPSGTSVFFKDHGLGIDLEKNKDKMFKLGSRLHNTSDGQGLGLFMTKRQLEAMGATIEVQSEVNQGTTFKLHFQH